MRSQFYLIKSGIMLDVVKKYIKDDAECRLAYSEFAENKGAKEYFCGLTKLYALKLDRQIEGWTIPNRKTGASRPKTGTKDNKIMKSLPELPNEHNIIASLTRVPNGVAYENSEGSGFSSIGHPTRGCGFLYVPEHDLYAFYVPDVKEALEKYEYWEITNSANQWSMDIEGVENITEAHWNYLVAKCDFDDEQG